MACVLRLSCRGGVLAHIWVAHRVGTDGPALRVALELAAGSGARVTVCHLICGGDDEPVDVPDALAREHVGQGAISRCHAETRTHARRCAPDVAVTSCVARIGAVADVLDLVRTARPDLAVVSTPRRRRARWLRRLLMPDETDLLIAAAPCPVLVIRP